MSRRQAKSRIDDIIDYDELLSSSSMSGLVSFLELPPSESVKGSYSDTLRTHPVDSLSSPALASQSDASLDKLSTGASVSLSDHPIRHSVRDVIPTSRPNTPLDSLASAALDSLAAIPSQFRLPDTCEINAEIEDEQHGGGLDSLSNARLPNSGATVYETQDGTRVDSRYVRLCDSVQSAHTASEQLVYTAMWKMLGSGKDENPSREGVISLGDLARRVAISRRNIQRIIQNLEQKYVLKVTGYEDKAHSTPRRYQIWGFRSTLDRRKEAGWTHVYRNRTLITLVRPVSLPSLVDPALDSLAKGAIARLSAIDSLATLDNLSGASLDRLSRERLDRLSSYRSKNKNNNEARATTTTEIRVILQGLLPGFDDEAVEVLWRNCRRRVPYVTPQEVGQLFANKLPDSLDRGIKNRNGFLIRVVPQSCTPASIGALRRAREVPKAVPIEHAAEDLQALLDDPATPKHIREFIEQRIRSTNAMNLTE